MRTALSLLALALCSTAAAEEPTYPKCALFNPSITVGAERIANGRAFAVKVGDRTLLVASHQILGPAGGRAKQMSAADAKKGFKQMVARDAFTNEECGRAKRMLDIEGKEIDLATHGKDDVAAFLAAKSIDGKIGVAFKPFELADKAPAKDDVVYLATRTASKKRLVQAKVAEVNDNFIFYDFPGVVVDDLMGSVGGPMLDAAGKVVGLHVSIGQLEDGTLFGAANPVSSLKEKLKAEALPELAAE